MSDAGRQPRHRWLPTLVVTSLVSALILFAVGPAATPATALGATVFKATACNVNLRSGATATSRVRALVPAATRVTVTATVSGGAWRTTCTGKIAAGRSWYRISAVNGKSVKSLYGVSYVYAPTGTFKAATVTRYVACGTKLRTRPTTGAPSRLSVALDARVTVVAKVTGSHWSRTCLGKAVAGSAWYRISAVNGKSVKSLYGVSYVYGLVGAFKMAPATTAAASKPAPPAPAGTGRSVRVSSVAWVCRRSRMMPTARSSSRTGPTTLSPANSQRAEFAVHRRPVCRADPADQRPRRNPWRSHIRRRRQVELRRPDLRQRRPQPDLGWLQLRQHGRGRHRHHRLRRGPDAAPAAPHHAPKRHPQVDIAPTVGRRRQRARRLLRPGAGDRTARPGRSRTSRSTARTRSACGAASTPTTDGASHPPSYNVTVRRLNVTGTLFPIVLWNDSAVQHDWLIDGASIRGASSYAVASSQSGQGPS